MTKSQGELPGGGESEHNADQALDLLMLDDATEDAIDGPDGIESNRTPNSSALTDEISDVSGSGGRTEPICRPSAAPDTSGWERLDPQPILKLKLRNYQEQALEQWIAAGCRGQVTLPTGAGKTALALAAVEKLGLRTVVVAPTIELLAQWRSTIVSQLTLPERSVGILGGGSRRVSQITVATYASAWRRISELNEAGLVVFDESHHLPAPSYRVIAERLKTPWRLGLSATPDRADSLHTILDHLIGPVVFRCGARELSHGGYLAPFRQEKRYVGLTEREQWRYEQLMANFQWYMARNRLGGRGFEQLVLRASSDPAAREALRCHQEARQIALNAEGKLPAVLGLLRQHCADRVLVFCEYTSVVDRLSRSLVVPSITYRTPIAERKLTLERFRQGIYSKLVTGRVLNEGVDVPDANVAIVVSGSATPREQIQRLGRVLRPGAGEATLYELVTRGTTEVRTSRSRRVRE